MTLVIMNASNIMNSKGKILLSPTFKRDLFINDFIIYYLFSSWHFTIMRFYFLTQTTAYRLYLQSKKIHDI